MSKQGRDLTIAHQIGLERYTTGEVQAIVKMLHETQKDILAQMGKDLKFLDGTTPVWGTKTRERLKGLQKSISEILSEGHQVLRTRLGNDLIGVGKYQADWLKRFYASPIGGGVQMEKPSAALLRSIVTQQPFQGHVLRDWAKKMESNQLDRIMQQIRLGMVQGESVTEMVKRLQGTGALKFRDGQFAKDKRGTESLVRTATSHVTNRTHYAFVKPYQEDFPKCLFIAILDQRTTQLCRSLDGKVFRAGEAPVPPLHWQCRSDLMWLSKYESATDFGAESDDGEETFDNWLRRQPRAIQNDALGSKQADAFRAGKFDLSDYKDLSDSPLSLKQLAVQDTAAFVAAMARWEEEELSEAASDAGE